MKNNLRQTPSKKTIAAFLFFATIFSILYQGYYFGLGDQGYFLAFLKKLVFPQLYKNDPLMDTLVVFFPGYVWKAIALFYHWVNLEFLMLVLHVVFRFLFFLAVFLLGKMISGKKEVGILAVLFWMTSKPSPAYEIFASNFLQSQFSIPLVLLSSFFFLKEKYLWAFALLSISFYAHPSIVAPMLAIYLLTLIFSKNFLHLVKYIFLFLVLTFPSFTTSFKVIKSAGAYDYSWIELMSIRNSHHLFPFSWPLEVWVTLSIFSGLFVISYFYVRRNIKIRIFKFFLLFQYLIFLGMILPSEILVVPRLLTYSPFHIGSFFAVFPSIVITMFLYKLIKDKDFKKQALGFLLSYVFFFNQYNLNFQKAFMLLLPVIFVLFFTLKKNLRVLFIGILTILLLWTPYMYYKNQVKQDKYVNDWIAAQKWAKNNTSQDSIFIVPTYLNGFRFYSERPQVVNWEDGGTGFYARSYMLEWWERMQDFGITSTSYGLGKQMSIYNSLTEKEFYRISKKYNAKYVIKENKKELNLPVVFSNENFSVYRLF